MKNDDKYKKLSEITFIEWVLIVIFIAVFAFGVFVCTPETPHNNYQRMPIVR